MRFASVLVIVMSLMVIPIGVSAKHDYVDISNPFLRKIPIAVPVFKAMSGSSTEAALTRKAADMLSDSLQFTGYFKMLDHSAFLIDPDKYDIVAPKINFQNWTVVGAELLVTGGVLAQGDNLDFELRLYDTFKERLVVGKRYRGTMADTRRIIHRFCSEIIFKLTGSYGVFNSKICFVSTTAAGQKEIFTCDFDGTNIKQFTANKSINLSPAWSSDGQWLAYTSYARGKPDLFIRHMTEKRGAVVTKEGSNISPAWFPGRFEVAASLSFSGDPEIYLLTGKGKVIKRLTNKIGIDVSPAWSPDGKRMAFVSKRAGSPQIYIKNIETGQFNRLTYQGKNNTQPSWSPRGDQIVYAAFEDGNLNIRVIGIDGKGLLQLTRDSGDNESPSWSPDGSLIVFSSSREGPSRIYVMTAFGTDQRRLLSLPGRQSEPKWSKSLRND